MRILHVINQFSGRAGAEISLRHLVLATRSRGIDHGIVVLKPVDNIFAGLPDDIQVFAPPSKLSLPAKVRFTREAARRFTPDLVHASLTEASVAARLAGRRSRAPVLVSVVSTTYAPAALIDRDVQPIKLQAMKVIDRALAHHPRVHFHALTDAVKDATVDDLRLPAERIRVIPRGRSSAAMGRRNKARREEVRARLDLDADAPMIIVVGREEPAKGHTYLIKALATIRRSRPDTHLVMVGRKGTRSAAIDDAISDLSLGDAVHRLGVRDDVPDLLCAADVFAFPSLYEGLGGAVIEAMAMEVPIVAADSPAVREVLANGRAGQLVPARDPEALARGLHQALAAPNSTAVAAARARFESRYELERVTEQMVTLWESCIASAG